MQKAVYKFGGASVKDADGFRNVGSIIKNANIPQLLIVNSAIADITNQLEKVVSAFKNDQIEVAQELLQKIKIFHFNIAQELLGENASSLIDNLSNALVEIEWILEEPFQDSEDYIYDQIVSVGEILSSTILATYLNHIGVNVIWQDARNYIKTDNNYQNANVNWSLSCDLIQKDLQPLLDKYIVVTQGFIGSSSENFSTTLGREGSDYSAALFCSAIDGDQVTIWKDVPGVLNADPKWFDETKEIPELSYQDAIELSYYGATVIHPKTIKPLQNKGIPLYVRSFKDLTLPGTKVQKDQIPLPIPSFIFKVNQVLLSISPKDFSFIIEENLSQIFSLFHKHQVSVNTMLNSALSFSVSVDDHPTKINLLIEDLKLLYKVKYNKGLELVTIRYYDKATVDRVTVDKNILLEIKSRYTCQLLMKNNDSL